MPGLRHLRLPLCAALTLAAITHAQEGASSPTLPSVAATQPEAEKPKPISDRQARSADDAYLAGAQQLAHNDPTAAQKNFTRAVELNPQRTEYALAMVVAREHRVTALVQKAAHERLLGHTETSAKLLAEAKELDPDNAIVLQHFPAEALPEPGLPGADRAENDIAHLGGPIHFAPTAGTKSFHRRGDVQDVLREVYQAFGIKATFDASIQRQQMRFDLDDVDFPTATRVLQKMTHVFAVPLTANSALLAKDSQENRDRLLPLVEETFQIPGAPSEQLNELSNIAKNIFDIKYVSVQKEGNRLVMRGNEDAMRLVNATFADMIDGGGEVILQVHIYEYDRSHNRDLGATLPTSAGAFSIAAEAQSLVSANQSLINQAVAAGYLTLDGNYVQNLIKSAAFLVLSGAVTTSKFSSFLGYFGGGLTLAGLYLGSSTTFNFLLSSTDVRLLDDIEIRIGDGQNGTVRSGSRYPIITSTYTSAASSAVTSALSGVTVNGTSAASLLSQYLGGSNTNTTPLVQYEDLGLTLKATPQIQKSGNVHIKLDMKIEALGGTSLNSIPILNNRQLVSDVTIPEGGTAMLASEVSSTEQRALTGLPGISEIPGFQGTDRSVETSSGELLITITPKIVRRRSPIIASRRLLANVSPLEQ